MAGNESELWPWWLRCVSPHRDRFEALLARHREPHRRYHGVDHVAWVIRYADHLIGEGALAGATSETDLAPIVAAAFYHDAIYDPRSARNEPDSAALAERELLAAGWERDAIARVVRMIIGTANHLDPPDAETAVLFDADLAVLGADPTGYRHYVDGIRFEYRHVDERAWRLGRSAVLRRFLGRDEIYSTPQGRTRWSARAIANVEAELATLG